MVTIASRMALIEGVGDEVVIFMSIVLFLLCVMLAWFSTSVAEQPLIRTAVLVIERRRTSSRINESVAETDRDLATAESTAAGKASSSFQPSTSEDGDHAPGSSNKNIQPGPSQTANDASALGATASVYTEDSLNESCVTEQGNDLRKRILTDDKSAPQFALSEPESPQNINTTSNENSDDGNIRIRLKFLNDTQRMVEGNLDEPLGEFKRRYFGEELENDKIVRLIFNGQLLRSDQETLQFYGLFDNCVVHCQISNNIAPPPIVQSETYNELDLSRFMLPLFGVILGAIWYCRVQYRQFFNATSTFALLGITGLFFVSLAAVFIPRREQRQPTWTVEENNTRR